MKVGVAAGPAQLNLKTGNGQVIHLVGSSVSAELQSTTTPALVLSPAGMDPIHVSDEGIELDTDLMMTGQPYTLHLDGVPLIAVKNPLGAVDFYTIP